MNAWESEYAAILDVRLRAGEIRAWMFEPFRIILAPKTTYLPDFLVIHMDGTPEIVEVKGRQREDAMVKFKVAAAMFPFWVFRMVSKRQRHWVDIRGFVFGPDTQPGPAPAAITSAAPDREPTHRAVARKTYAEMLADPELKKILALTPPEIYTLRHRLCLAVEDMADAVGMSVESWRAIEAGKTKVYHHRHVLAIKKLQEKVK